MQAHPSQLTPAEAHQVLAAVAPIAPLVADIDRLLFDLHADGTQLPALALQAQASGDEIDLIEAQARAAATAATLHSLLGVLALRLGPACDALDAALNAASTAEVMAEHFPTEA
ncbi:hypothetical protein V5F41_12475 [Xanthobacter autotrophicus]|uniref:hypothetical protein n=1 Tax=Xanthobacter autotrophicus TaxID=280 RepID=UPI0037266983